LKRLEFGHRDFENFTDSLGKELLELAHVIERNFQEQRRLLAITEHINQGVLLEQVLKQVYDSFRPLIPYDRMGLALLEDDGETVLAHWARSESHSVQIKAGYARTIKGSSLATIIETGEPRVINDLERYLEEHPASSSTRLAVEEGIRSSLTCPLVAMGKPVGFLFFSSMDKNTYEQIHQRLFRQIAGLLSSILEKSRLYEELLRVNAELVEAREALKHQATHDGLTGLLNRSAILEMMEKELARARRAGTSFVTIMIDVDNFKHLNDTYGHPAGDEVLREVARRLEYVARRGDSVGRYGGEEFLVVLSHESIPDAEKVAERYRAQIASKPMHVGSQMLTVTISVGAGIRGDLATASSGDLLKVADDALYRAKAAGRNCVDVRTA
jgi:diguanylate cyclase (GGDEF)-like protein